MRPDQALPGRVGHVISYICHITAEGLEIGEQKGRSYERRGRHGRPPTPVVHRPAGAWSWLPAIRAIGPHPAIAVVQHPGVSS